MAIRNPPQSSIDFEISPSFLPKEAAELIATTTKVWDGVASINLDEATFANAILPILHDEDARSQRATDSLGCVRCLPTGHP